MVSNVTNTKLTYPSPVLLGRFLDIIRENCLLYILEESLIPVCQSVPIKLRMFSQGSKTFHSWGCLGLLQREVKANPSFKLQ